MTVLYTLVIVIALLLGTLILIQPSKSGGFGSVFGGVGESVFGARAGSHLTKATVVLTVIFFVLALLLAALIGHTRSNQSLVLSAPETPAAVQEAAPAAEVPAETPAEAPAAPAAESPAK